MWDLLLFVASTFLQLIVSIFWLFFAAVLLRAFYDTLAKRVAGSLRSVTQRDNGFAKPVAPFRDPRDSIIAERDRTIAQKDRELTKLREKYSQLTLAFRYRGCEIGDLRAARFGRVVGCVVTSTLLATGLYFAMSGAWNPIPYASDDPESRSKDSTSPMDAGQGDATFVSAGVAPFDRNDRADEPIVFLVVTAPTKQESFVDFPLALPPDRRALSDAPLIVLQTVR